VNSNININGIDIAELPQETNNGLAAESVNEADADGAIAPSGNDGELLSDSFNEDKTLINVCINENFNEQTIEEPIPPIPSVGRDLAVTKNDGTVSMLLGIGNRTFDTADDIQVGGNGSVAVAVGEFN